MNKPSTAVNSSSSKGLFFFLLAIFVASVCAFAFVMKLDRTVERTTGKIIETYSKKTFVSRKSSVEKEYGVVRYSVGGTEHTGHTLKRTGSDMVQVYYYKAFPSMAWYYKRENPNIVYCCIFMTLSLIGVILARPKGKKTLPLPSAKAQQKKK
jgi:hypothetical protein